MFYSSNSTIQLCAAVGTVIIHICINISEFVRFITIAHRAYPRKFIWDANPPPTPHRNSVNGENLLIATMLKPLLHSVDRDIFRSVAIHMFCICHLVLLHELIHGSREYHHIIHVYSPFGGLGNSRPHIGQNRIPISAPQGTSRCHNPFSLG